VHQLSRQGLVVTGEQHAVEIVMADQRAAAWPQHPMDLAQQAWAIGHALDHVLADHAVDAPRLERQRRGDVGLDRCQRPRTFGGTGQAGRVAIERNDPAGRSDRQQQSVQAIAVAAPEIEHVLARADVGKSRDAGMEVVAPPGRIERPHWRGQ
jgi:hypothetical protein